MNPQILRKFIKQTGSELRLSDLVEEAMTGIAGGLYPYLLFLQSANRKVEVEMIEDIRKQIFVIRDDYLRSNVLNQLHVDHLNITYQMLSIQVKMLATAPERSWESALFTSLMNDFCGYNQIFKDIINRENIP